jgi:hypothetical protein
MRRERRTHFRIGYPISARPRARIGEVEYSVLEISERGLRFAAIGPDEFQSDQEVTCLLTFKDGESFELRGRVAHSKTGRYVGVHLSDQIPLARIMSEQRHLILRFPRWRPNDE